MVEWKKQALELLKKAVNCLDYAGIPFGEWTFGGGTALMFQYWHRESKDIDIFLFDIQYLTALSPRLNDFAEEICTDYKEAANFVKLSVGDREIDFIVAPNLSGYFPIKTTIDGIDLLIEQPEEILAKKFYYRTDRLKLRDLYDAFVVLNSERANSVKEVLKELLAEKKEVFLNRLNFLNQELEKKGFDEFLKSLKVPEQIAEKLPMDFPFRVASELGLGEDGDFPSP